MRRILTTFFLCFFLLLGCQEKIDSEPILMSSNTAIQIGEQGETFVTRHKNQVRINNQHGISFYNLDWEPIAPAKVSFEHGKHSFTVENALGVVGYQNNDFSEEGLSELDIVSGITASDLISHDEARLKFFAILEKIRKAGWKSIIDRGDPRLRGKDMLEYVLTASNASSLDANYLPSFKEWMQIESLTRWDFYADQVYLEVYFMREQTLKDPEKPGSYLVQLKFKNEANHLRSYVDPYERKKWKELLPAELAKLEPMRAEAEAKFRARGFKIDETYQDPPVPDLSDK